MKLALGPGPLPRLLAPGVPDWIGADGARIGWTLRDRLFLLQGDAVAVVELPDEAESVSAGAARWTVGLGGGFVRVDPAKATIEELLLDDEAEPLTTHAGEDVGMFVELPEHRLLRLSDGRPLLLPAGALRARLARPWARGHGACWVDGDLLFRAGGRIEAIGRAEGAVELACGPDGAVVVELGDDAVVAAPRRAAVRAGRGVDAESARFSPDGTDVLVAVRDGVARIDLATGHTVGEWAGSLAPVGFLGGAPVLWDLDRGELIAGGRLLAEGFAAARPAFSGNVLAGPGGSVWDLATGARAPARLRDGACATDGNRVAHVDDTRVRVLGGLEFAHGLCRDEDAVDAARIEGDAIVITTLDGEVGRFSLVDGARVERTHQRVRVRRAPEVPEGVRLPALDEESTVHVGERAWPVPADGAARVGEAVWVWTREGSLVVLPG